MKKFFFSVLLILVTMTTTNAQSDSAEYTYVTVPTQFVEANGIKFAYRSYGKKSDVPVIYFNHLTANLDNCDPRIMDAIAAHRTIISFDYRGIGATTGRQGESLADMAKDGVAFIHALGYKEVDIMSFSMGGMISQEILLVEPSLVRKLILAGTGPRGGAGISAVVGRTYGDIFRGLLTFRDPKYYLFFNQDKIGKAGAKDFLDRLKERKENRDRKVKLYTLKKQLKAIKNWGNADSMDLSVFKLPVLIVNGDNDRMVPSSLSSDMAHRFPNVEQMVIYPNSGHGGVFQYYTEFLEIAIPFLNK
jgi:pimeloyl-ACP methyl ester carboxylesterase